MSWRKLFPIIFLFTCVDGFISNYFYPAKLPFLLKDIFILIVYFLFFITKESQEATREFKKSIGFGIRYLAILLMLLGALQIFNPGVPNVLIGILGFKIMFFYWLLAILAYAYIDSLDSLRHFVKIIVYFSIPICIFGIYQFWQGPQFMLTTFSPGFKRALIMASVSGGAFLRVFGTFASSGQFSNFLVINSVFIFGLLFTSKYKFEKSMMIGCLVLNYITMLCTGTRGGLIILFFSVAIFVVLCRWLWRTFFIIFLLIVSFTFGFNYLGKTVLSRFESIKDVKMVRQRTIEVTGYTFRMYLEKFPFGKGLGTASGATRHILEEEFPGEREFIENYPAKLQFELGIIGVALFYLFLLNLTLHWMRHWIKIVDHDIYIFIAVFSSYCWVMFIVSLFGILDTPPQAIFIWAMAGFCAKLATLHSNDKYPLST